MCYLIRKYKLDRLTIQLNDKKYELRKWYHNDIRRLILLKEVDILVYKIKKLKER